MIFGAIRGSDRLHVPLQGATIRPQLATGSGMLAAQTQQAQQEQQTGVPPPVAPGQKVTGTQADASSTTVTVGGSQVVVRVSLPQLHTSALQKGLHRHAQPTRKAAASGQEAGLTCEGAHSFLLSGCTPEWARSC